MDGWVDGWVGGKAGLRIAYSNQKSRGRLVQWESVRLPIQRSEFASRCFFLAALRNFMRDLDLSEIKRNTPSTGEEKWSSTLSLYEGERSPEKLVL